MTHVEYLLSFRLHLTFAKVEAKVKQLTNFIFILLFLHVTFLQFFGYFHPFLLQLHQSLYCLSNEGGTFFNCCQRQR